MGDAGSTRCTLDRFPSLSAVADPLPSWKVSTLKGAIVEFVTDMTTPGSAELGAGEERIAVFDNDGTLWVEKPIYTQLAFAIDWVKALAPDPLNLPQASAASSTRSSAFASAADCPKIGWRSCPPLSAASESLGLLLECRGIRRLPKLHH
jgi:hypothetical protein